MIRDRRETPGWFQMKDEYLSRLVIYLATLLQDINNTSHASLR